MKALRLDNSIQQVKKICVMKNLLVISIVLIPMLSCVHAQTKVSEQLEAGLSSGKLSVSQVLTDPAYLDLHPDRSFNELVKKYAKQEKIRLVATHEPGKHITVKGRIVDNNNTPLSNTLIYVYQTDNRGLYSNPKSGGSAMQGDNRHPYLFGYFKTMNDGGFQFQTIHPKGYPGGNIPQHIHLEVYDNSGKALLVTELLFDDDERLIGSVREQMIKGGNYVAANTGTAKDSVYSYKIKMR